MNNNRAKVSANERLKSRYMRARHSLRSISLTKNNQKEIMFLIQRIEDYGFNFFPDHYIRDQVVELEAILDHATSTAA